MTNAKYEQSVWQIDSISQDPLWDDLVYNDAGKKGITEDVNGTWILSASIPIDSILQDSSLSGAMEGRAWKVGLADFCARRFKESNLKTLSSQYTSIRLEGLEESLQTSKRRKRNNVNKKPSHPYVLERSDFYCTNDKLCIVVRVLLLQSRSESTTTDPPSDAVRDDCQSLLERIFVLAEPSVRKSLLQHLCSLTIQQKLRSKLDDLESIAFIGDGSILPRKSGTSDAPMKSPPAVPFRAPKDSKMATRELSIEIPSILAEHIPPSMDAAIVERTKTSITISGLLVPKGITLICGGGYHGKSTLLQAIAVGQYDKIPGDGRELCVGLSDAVMVRAEDGRYVNNCNISAFISNLPTPPGVTKTLDTTHFSTRDSSGSTSQASNVVEAIELGAKALLVDEDISAANFMARDGRMRALVMDESITPLLYRVNGLYNTHGISTVVVVGGVGDWLDVPHQVILLDKYVASDATKKAQSISRQFSHGHVQYAGRGVVHRLEWEKSGTPTPRRPTDAFSNSFDTDIVVSLQEGGRGLVLYKDSDDEDAMELENDDEEEGCIDASRLQQLLGKNQLFAAGLCATWILQNAGKNPKAGLKDLLHLLDSKLDREGGMSVLLKELKESKHDDAKSKSKSMIQVLESVGYLERPRNFEVGQALTRMRGIQFEELPVYDDGSEEAARIEAENRKKALLAIWENRRKSKTNRFASS